MTKTHLVFALALAVLLFVLGCVLSEVSAQPGPTDAGETDVASAPADGGGGHPYRDAGLVAVPSSEAPPADSEAAPAEPDVEAETARLVAAVQSREFWPAVLSALVILIGMARKLLGSRIAWFRTRPGGYVLSYTTTLVLAILYARQSGEGFSWALLGGAVAAAWGAAGGLENFYDFARWVKRKLAGPETA